MLLRLAADALVLLHLVFILFVLGGGLLLLRWPRLAWLHLPAVAWGAVVELCHLLCPLTPWENQLRRAAGQAGYDGGFVEHYLIPLIYPAGLTSQIQLWLGALVLLVNGAVYGWLLWRWWPRRTQMPALLRVLFVGFAWLPIAFALYAAQSVQFAATSEFVLGRAPAHALFIGFFGSLLVAMVTRVTQGHSGRPLVFGGVATFAFVAIQCTCVVRIVAELVPDQMAWQAVAAIGWLLAFLPWVLRSGWIYLTPRADGKPG